ncbi:MAG TPA: hypothetical protein VJY34_00730 [Roseiarcus sp.]|nr:hypothetical protein [Roseiarcus sp.]
MQPLGARAALTSLTKMPRRLDAWKPWRIMRLGETPSERVEFAEIGAGRTRLTVGAGNVCHNDSRYVQIIRSAHHGPGARCRRNFPRAGGANQNVQDLRSRQLALVSTVLPAVGARPAASGIVQKVEPAQYLSALTVQVGDDGKSRQTIGSRDWRHLQGAPGGACEDQTDSAPWR